MDPKFGIPVIKSIGQRLALGWSRYWFPHSTGLNLAICRIVITGAVLLFFFPSVGGQLNLINYNQGFRSEAKVLAGLSSFLPDGLLRNPTFIISLHWVTFTSGIFLLVGLLSRGSSLIFAFGYLILVSHQWSYGSPNKIMEAMCVTFFFLMAFSPCGFRVSIDALLRRRRKESQEFQARERVPLRNAMWPLKLTQITVASAYLNAGYYKLINGGIEWINGYGIAFMHFDRGVQLDLPLAIWIAERIWLCVILSFSTVAFELLFFVGLIWKRALPVFLVIGVLFHMSIFLVRAGHPGFLSWIVLYLTFLNFESTPHPKIAYR